jgi:hypothetical protein
MPFSPGFPPGAPADQADGLRRLFGAQRKRFVALAHNPHVAFGGVVIERLTAAFAQRGLHTLVVDAADSARAPHELATVELAGCVETLSSEVSFLAARGLPLRHVDSRGSTAGFLNAVLTACPQADVVLVHAGASDLARLFGRRALRPLLLADDRADSLTSAYAAMKLLAQRTGVMAYDLVLTLRQRQRLADTLAQRLANTADRFLGAVLHDWAVVDPTADPNAPVTDDLARLAQALLTSDDEHLPPVLPGLAMSPAAAWTN